MNVIKNYSEGIFYTFETSVIGKEYTRVIKGLSQVLIPGFQVELKINGENRFFEKEYFLFNNVSFFKASYSYFDSEVIDEYETRFLFKEKCDKMIEFESLAFRDNSITFCTYIIEFEILDIYYNKEFFNIQDIYASNLESVIEKRKIKNFLNLKEIDLDINIPLHEILLVNK